MTDRVVTPFDQERTIAAAPYASGTLKLGVAFL
jgi:hypothetical protein